MKTRYHSRSAGSSVWTALIFTLLASSTGWVWAQAVPTGAPATSATALATTTAALREVAQTYPAEAVVEAVKQATLAAQVTGRILEVRVDAGDQVKAGQVLLRIDAREAAEGLAAARAQLGNAQANLQRVKNLVAQKFVSQAALDKAEADYQTAAANAAQASATSGHALIVAPFAGVVAQRLAEAGEMANPGRPLISLFEPKDMRVVASIPQYQLAAVRQAQQGQIEFPGNGQWLDARRIEILPTVDASSHTVRVRLYLPVDAAAAGGIVPGLFARAHFVTGTARKLLVPASTIVRRGELTALYVVTVQGQPRLRQVRLGEVQAGGQIEVLAGLSAGEKVALDPLKASFQASQSR
ncbi:MAG: efflux RND transporter periplasmic adaptor subunit [Sterolibacterium sp.]|nr:efflux RND transporter periplasmic adaptor subunit [Sterolibacterium sp.]